MYKNKSYASTKVNQPCHGNGWTQESMSLFYGLFRTTPTLEAYWSSTVACLVFEISLPADLQRRSSPTISVQCRTSGDQANGALCRRKTSFLTMSIKSPKPEPKLLLTLLRDKAVPVAGERKTVCLLLCWVEGNVLFFSATPLVPKLRERQRLQRKRFKCLPWMAFVCPDEKTIECHKRNGESKIDKFYFFIVCADWCVRCSEVHSHCEATVKFLRRRFLSLFDFSRFR